jgi:hypothetical protein
MHLLRSTRPQMERRRCRPPRRRSDAPAPPPEGRRHHSLHQPILDAPSHPATSPHPQRLHQPETGASPWPSGKRRLHRPQPPPLTLRRAESRLGHPADSPHPTARNRHHRPPTPQELDPARTPPPTSRHAASRLGHPTAPPRPTARDRLHRPWSSRGVAVRRAGHRAVPRGELRTQASPTAAHEQQALAPRPPNSAAAAGLLRWLPGRSPPHRPACHVKRCPVRQRSRPGLGRSQSRPALLC